MKRNATGDNHVRKTRRNDYDIKDGDKIQIKIINFLKNNQMEKKRTNNLYHVQVVKCAWVSVEADSPSEAMRIAEKYIDDYVTDEDFEDSDIETNGCESYSHEIENDLNDRIFCDDGVIDAEEYARLVEEAEK